MATQTLNVFYEKKGSLASNWQAFIQLWDLTYMVDTNYPPNVGLELTMLLIITNS